MTKTKSEKNAANDEPSFIFLWFFSGVHSSPLSPAGAAQSLDGAGRDGRRGRVGDGRHGVHFCVAACISHSFSWKEACVLFDVRDCLLC